MPGAMLELNDFRAWISSNGRRVEQFDIDYDYENNTVSCWIAGTILDEFTVHWRCKNPENASSGHVWIDGKDVASAIIRPGNFSPVQRNGAKLKDGRMRPFTFAKLNLTDDDRMASPHDPSLADIGSIEVRIAWVKLGPAKAAFEGYDAHSRGLVHEKSKKMGAIHTVYGKAVAVARTRATTTAPLDPDNPGPHAKFIFRYRTIEMLQAVGIAPRPTRKRAAPEEDDEEETMRSRSSPVHIDLAVASGDEEEEEPPSTKPEPSSPKRARLWSEEKSDDDAEQVVDTKPLFLDDDDAAEIEMDPLANTENDREDTAAATEEKPRTAQASPEVADLDGGATDAKPSHFFDDNDDDEEEE
ncbi:hypothetical protein DL93DRAFT_2162840 [Clavulina sp. PMI_390]|nr:hypothetical protein DL93DRAFT_2162840 [Clavulina sp. PMI_390]